MDKYTMAEQAYKNGYETGVKRFVEKVKEKNGNDFLESWYESADICYEFNQEGFESFVDKLVESMIDE